MKTFSIIHWIGFFGIVILFSSCDNNRNEPGWSFFNDMEHSQAYETWSENPNLPEGKTMTGPVEGTVAIHEHAFGFVRTPEDELKAASLTNPVANDFNRERAQLKYEQYCIVCHGEKGDGKGHLFTSGKYPIPPANYHAERAMEKTDGQLFHNIRIGFGVMGAHGPQLSVDDTWQLVNYIRHLQAQPIE
ncbi:quinol:cytochrome c oxidoreductase monoheme cytochrome subunit [Mariniphaga anaerophila]|uniref:Quinol:cytochrome c oxidoreductase monoheme cytochrome subunit n=1 Tax=Mariniphaga anaerophila TaxID=1484053 RepID=A0A1M5DBT7_9BACT|nr:cytochrome c [Mariniphaga anaerophila]SHF64416.1 quinol:cytochrome c oxidoreductase monoheme cytochrome subunit [Mariniphaga anaerophila]